MWSTNPWLRLREMRDEMNRVFGDYMRPRAGGFPPVNVYANEEGVLVTAEIPGVDPSTLEVVADRDTITFSGQRERPADAEQSTWHRRERRIGPFSRRLQLPYAIDSESVEVKCGNGVLTVRLRRPEEQKPRQIRVDVS